MAIVDIAVRLDEVITLMTGIRLRDVRYRHGDTPKATVANARVVDRSDSGSKRAERMAGFRIALGQAEGLKWALNGTVEPSRNRRDCFEDR